MVSHNIVKRRRTEPPEVRRRLILEAARSVLLKKGYQEASLDDVAAAANVAKGTLYLYFKDKSSLVEAVFAGMLDSLEARLPLPGAGEPRAALRLAVEESLAFFDEQRDFLARFSAPGLCGGALKERFRRHVERLARLLAAGVKAKVLRPHDPQLGAVVLMSLVRGFLMRKIHLGDKKPLRDRAGEVFEMLLRGLGA